MLLLAIDTSGAQGGVALLDGERVLAEQALTLDRKASTTLLPAIAQLFKQTGLAPADLQALAVALGPGSFTGIRIGLATAQGIAQALNLPVYGLSSLRVLAEPCERGAGPLAVLRRARAGECYFCVYDACWKEIVPEGRYSDDEIIGMLRQLAPHQLFLADTGDFDASEADIAVQAVTAQVACLGRLAHRLAPGLGRVGGVGLVPRHYAPNFRTKKS